jgi:hypothetical protein
MSREPFIPVCAMTTPELMARVAWLRRQQARPHLSQAQAYSLWQRLANAEFELDKRKLRSIDNAD